MQRARRCAYGARTPAAAAFKNLQTVERYALAGQKALDAERFAAARQGRRSDEERARAAAAAKPRPEDPAAVAAFLREAMRADVPKPCSSPGAAAPAPTRSAAEPLVLLQVLEAEGRGEVAGETGDVAIQIVKIAAFTGAPPEGAS